MNVHITNQTRDVNIHPSASLRYSVGNGEGTGLDLTYKIIGGSFGIGGHIAAGCSVAYAIALEIKGSGIIGEFSCLKCINRAGDRFINTLECTGNNATIDAGLVLVYTNTIDALLIGSLQRTDATTTGNLEDNIGTVLVDLAGRHVLTFSCIGEAL